MQDKITKSIKLIQDLQKPDQEYVVAFSAGKDSIVILDLVKRSGVPYTVEYSNTTIGPPGTMKFIREHYPEVKILQPEKSFDSLNREFQKEGFKVIKDVVNQFKAWERNAVFGIIDKQSMQPEVKSVYEKYINNEIDEGQAKRMIDLMRPILETRLR